MWEQLKLHVFYLQLYLFHRCEYHEYKAAERKLLKAIFGDVVV